MGFLCISSRIEVLRLPLISGSHFQKVLNTHVNLSTTFHPLTDRQEKHTIQTLEDILRACVIDFKGSYDYHFSLIEFAYNNSYCSSIHTSRYDALCGR